MTLFLEGACKYMSPFTFHTGYERAVCAWVWHAWRHTHLQQFQPAPFSWTLLQHLQSRQWSCNQKILRGELCVMLREISPSTLFLLEWNRTFQPIYCIELVRPPELCVFTPKSKTRGGISRIVAPRASEALFRSSFTLVTKSGVVWASFGCRCPENADLDPSKCRFDFSQVFYCDQYYWSTLLS